MDFCDHKVPDEKLNVLIDEFQDRLRVSDSIGWYRMKLAVLLPETDLEGATLVCNSPSRGRRRSACNSGDARTL